MHNNAIERLKQVADVVVYPYDSPKLRAMIGECDRMIVYSPRFDPAILREARRLKVIACHACPHDIANAASERGIRVTLVPSLWDTVADMALALMFAAARMVPQAHAAIKSGLWGTTDLKVRFSGYDIFGKTLGIVGLGKIGTILAKRVQSFDMRIVYYDPIRTEFEEQLNLEYRPLD